MAVCARHGCPNVVDRGECESCRKASQRAYDERRGSAAARGYGARWRALSKALRSRELRWCGDTMPGVPETGDSTCPRRGLHRVPSAVIDHIVPVAGPKDPKFWDRQNYQGLCAHDHDRKRQREARDGR